VNVRAIKQRDGRIPAAKLNDADVVGLYFSAHWCPPCRNFTPKLSKFYTDMKAAGKKFELVFVSSDKEQQAFDEYHGEMTFSAVPYENRDLKKTLSSKYKVEGIPTLVLLDAKTGETITKSGVEKVYGDLDGKNFPWHPKPFAELLGDSFVDAQGKKFDASSFKDKYLGIYFSAHWCGPCRAFTPQLSKFYSTYGEDKNLEIVFSSSDKDQQAFDDYLAEMPWKAIPFSESARRSGLSDHFEVQGIPTFVILDKDRKMITNNGRGAVMSDPDGADFPWKLRKVGELNGMTASQLNEAPAIVVLADQLKGEEQKKVISQFVEVGNSFHADGKEDYELRFFYTKGAEDLASRLKKILKLDASAACYVVVDFPNQSYHVTSLKFSSSADEIKELANNFTEKKLTFTSLG